jgi:hypothetical protein
MSLIYSLDSADVLDTDGDGLGDTLEDGLDGYSALNEDSNDDGVSDRVEYESSQSN